MGKEIDFPGIIIPSKKLSYANVDLHTDHSYWLE